MTSLITCIIKANGSLETGIRSYIEGDINPRVGHYICSVIAVDDEGNRQTSGGDSYVNFCFFLFSITREFFSFSSNY